MEFLMQPIGRSALLEEVGESLVPAPLVAGGGVLAEQAVPEQQMAAESGEAYILSAAEGAAGRRESSPPTSELSTGKMNPQAPGCNKRLRIGAAAPSTTPCPTRISAFEMAVKCFAENQDENVITPVLGTTFDSLGEAYDFLQSVLMGKGFWHTVREEPAKYGEVGVNNHFQSVIMAGVLVRDKTKESFEWVFSEFLRLMGGSPPVTILTDQNRAMELAIKSIMPNMTHR